MNDAVDHPTLGERVFVLVQRYLPTRALSACMFGVASVRASWFKNALIRTFMRFYPIDLGEAMVEEADAYPHFNAFFTRALKPGRRPQPLDPAALSSPVDGSISQFGRIGGDRLIQAKGHAYTVTGLLADAAGATAFTDGDFITIYLAPHNYHRVHMPCAGRLRSWSYVPGRLFSVNPVTARGVPGLFARNERLVAIFDTAFGPLAYVMVGALLVGGIETVFGGRLTPPHRRRGGPSTRMPESPIDFDRGAELGRFHMGSTVILLAPRGCLRWTGGLAPAKPLRLGDTLATIQTTPSA